MKYSPSITTSIVPIKKTESLIFLLGSQMGTAKYVSSVEQIAQIVNQVSSYQVTHNDVKVAAPLITERMTAT